MGRKRANELKKGNYFIPDEIDEPFEVVENQHSKSGKHGSAKSRVTAVGLFSGNKKSWTFKSDDMIVTPTINKRSGQLITIDEANKTVQVMDTETYETLDVEFPLDKENKVSYEKLDKLINNPDVWGETQIEFWDVMNKMFITRIVLPDYI